METVLLIVYDRSIKSDIQKIEGAVLAILRKSSLKDFFNQKWNFEGIINSLETWYSDKMCNLMSIWGHNNLIYDMY